MKKLFIVAGLGLLTSVIAVGQTTTKKPASATKKSTTTKKKPMSQSNFEIKTNQERVSYSLGINIAANVTKQGFDSLDARALAEAFKDYLNKQPLLISEGAAEQVIQEYFTGLQKAKAEKNKKAGIAFLEANKSKPGVVTLPSGLQYQVITEGTGPIPTATNTVTTHYHGTLIDGTVFDSSVQRGQPASFPVNGVIQGWVEALQLMKVGSKWRLFIPSNLAYGERGAPGGTIGPDAALIFEVELISIDK
jgi:FKBP-type peptidyl-prolyl cis-trans isomerase FklB